MAWTVPITFVQGDPLTAAQLNIFLRDNMTATEVGVAGRAGRLITSDGLNAISEKQWARSYRSPTLDVTSEFPSTEDDIGPTVTVDHGGRILIMFDTRMHVSSGSSAAQYAPMVNGQLIDSGVNEEPVSRYASFIRNGTTNIMKFSGWAMWYGDPGRATITMAYGYYGAPATAQYLQSRVTAIPF